MPHEKYMGAHHRENRVLGWVTAAVVGAFSGLSGAIAQTQIHFRTKLTDSIAQSDTHILGGKKGAIQKKLKNTALSPEEVEALTAESEAISKRIELKKLYDNRAASLDENFFQRLVKSFRSDKTVASEAAATGEYLGNASKLKSDFSEELLKFSKEHLGIERKGLKGTLQRFQFMGKETKFTIAMNTAIATTVGAAGTLMFFNSLNTHNKLDELVSHNNKDSAQR